MATHVNCYDFTDELELACGACGWRGHGGDVTLEIVGLASELYEGSCPKCFELVAVVPFATHEETRAAAAAGIQSAVAALPGLEAREAFLDHAWARELKEREELPEIEADHFKLIWDQEGDDTVIRHGEREIWRERAYWEGSDRFVDVYEILRRRYGERMTGLWPTGESMMCLGGDHFSPAYRKVMREQSERKRKER